MPRQRVAGTVAQDVAAEVRLIHFAREQKAKKDNQPLPDYSHVLEEILREGLRAIKAKSANRQMLIDKK